MVWVVEIESKALNVKVAVVLMSDLMKVEGRGVLVSHFGFIDHS